MNRFSRRLGETAIRSVVVCCAAVLPWALLGCAAERNATAALLGDADGWDTCRIELHAVEPTAGGLDVVLDGRGGCEVQRVDAAGQAARLQLGLGRERARAVFTRAIEDDLATLPPAAAGEPRLRLVGPTAERSVPLDGPTHDAVDALRALAETDAEPYWEGRYDPRWHPLEGAEVQVLLHAVDDDPRWNLPPDALEPVLERLADLEPATPVQRPALGYRGIRLRFRGGRGPGPNVEVFAGTVLIQQRDGDSETRADDRGLERWLRDMARERGIELPE